MIKVNTLYVINFCDDEYGDFEPIAIIDEADTNSIRYIIENHLHTMGYDANFSDDFDEWVDAIVNDLLFSFKAYDSDADICYKLNEAPYFKTIK